MASSHVVTMKAAIAALIRVAQNNGYVVAGFAFGLGRDKQSPLMVNFGNCTDCGSESLYAELCRQAEEKREAGKSESEQVLPLQ